MPLLRTHDAEREFSLFPIDKNITTIGSSADCDICLDDPEIAPVHCQIHFDGQIFHLSTIERDAKLLVNERAKRRHDLQHDDQLTLGNTRLVFSLLDQVEDHTSARPEAADASRYRRLFEFSSKLLGTYKFDELLEALMDSVVGVTSADKGFLVLWDNEVPRICVARNLKQENIDDAIDQLSDSIIARVLATKQPLIVSDALKDDQFANAKSIMKLNVVSVMCVPLMDKETLIGLIYVGNDNVVALFDDRSLEALTIFAAQASLIVKNALLIDELRGDRDQLRGQIESMRFGRLIGSCEAMRLVFEKVRKVATTDISVLITGETGTGKELIAKEIHDRSSREKGPFVTINCGAIPENLLESELFGHVKGAFTGAIANKLGKFQSANGGTLFLDEVGELPVLLQVKLLRALQEKTVVRVGSTRPEFVDIRILAATNRDLEQGIKNGDFREDLYYRVNVVNIRLPPLRERGDDILVIAKYFLNRYNEEFATRIRGFSPNATIAMRKYHWPGNIRQLENHIKKAVVLADAPLLAPEDLDLNVESLPPIVPLAQAKEDFQRDYINEALQRNNGNRTKTARDLGVDPRTIFRHLEREDGTGEDEA